jgi:hypothetical protein
MIRVVLLALLLLAPAALLAQDQGPNARRILDNPEYRGYRVERADYKPGESSSSGSSDSGRSSEDPGYRRSTEAGPHRRPAGGDSGGSSGTSSLNPPEWIGPLFEGVAWVLLIGAAAVALFFIVKALLGIKWKRKPKPKKIKGKRKAEKKDNADATDEPEQAPDDSPGQEFVDALVLAQREFEQALRDGDWARAALLSYRIFWLKAGWRGCVEDTDVRTWRDALRMVRAADTRSRMRQLLGLMERVRYGEHVPAREEFEAWKRNLDQVHAQEALK